MIRKAIVYSTVSLAAATFAFAAQAQERVVNSPTAVRHCAAT